MSSKETDSLLTPFQASTIGIVLIAIGGMIADCAHTKKIEEIESRLTEIESSREK
jgi:hypothetical protein